jgi:uncharacterized membrane protein YjfL (UPF0719 family)
MRASSNFTETLIIRTIYIYIHHLMIILFNKIFSKINTYRDLKLAVNVEAEITVGK